jgi:flagellar motility protein MotE (MotC chaperone)
LKDEPQGQISKLITNDPTLLTPAEIDLLQQLAERRQVLESREQEFEIRTGLLAAAESRIDKKVEELKVLRETISGLIKTFDAQQDAKLLSLVKIYENMKPKEAAKIFEALQMDTLLEVAERMKERKLAPIMAKMDPEKARDMTVELSRLRQLPPVGQQAGG